jgi:hypothetical protein
MDMAPSAEARVREILDELSGLGAVLAGSISARHTRCQREGCHCRVEPAVLHGPYPTWTWRPKGVSVTKTLTVEQAERLGPYAEAHRRLRALIGELEELSLDVIDRAESTDLARSAHVGNRARKAGK